MNKIRKILSKHKLLTFIFIFGILIRFLYFPDDLYFAYDQARDAFISQNIFSGDFKIVGPPASVPGLFHGALSYYIFGVLYKISAGSPYFVSIFFRIYNVLGIVILYIISKKLFDTKTAVIASFIYSVSFEQTQYSLFLGHPALAVLSVLLYYLGLAMLLKEKKEKGIVLSFVGLGLSIQFHLSLSILFLQYFTILSGYLFFSKKKPLKSTIQAVLIFLFLVSTYLVSEIKFGFQNSKNFIEMFKGGSGSSLYMQNFINILQRFINHNIFDVNTAITYSISLLLVIAVFMLLRSKRLKISGFILLFWMFTGIAPYLRSQQSFTVYHYSIGGSVSVVVLVSFILSQLLERTKLTYLIILLIALSNIKLISKYNQFGTISEISVQDNMLLSDEIKVLDYIYNKASREEFSVNALTNPYNVNTTWNYLFEWYGKNKYGYVPIWGGWAAPGYEGNMTVITSQSDLPGLRFSIFEPTRGIPDSVSHEFKLLEGQFWRIVEQKEFGDFIVQERVRI